jgi:DNA-binding MarR family transcriptional regulator
MKYVTDDAGLYNPAVREALARFADGGDTTRFEAASAVRAAAHAIERLRGAGARSLSSGAVDVLLRLSVTDDGVSVGELARSAGVSARNATGLVDTLEKADLVRRTPDPDDRRSVLIAMTDTGRAWVADFRQPANMAMNALFHGFTEEELTQLRHLSLRVVTNQLAIEQRMGSQ